MSVADDYVDGDVNTLEDQASAAERAANAIAALEFIATSLADDPSAVKVEAEEKGGKIVLSLSVAADDMGRVIGRRGRTAQAIRSLIGAAGARDGVTTSVDILD